MAMMAVEACSSLLSIDRIHRSPCTAPSSPSSASLGKCHQQFPHPKLFSFSSSSSSHYSPYSLDNSSSAIFFSSSSSSLSSSATSLSSSSSAAFNTAFRSRVTIERGARRSATAVAIAKAEANSSRTAISSRPPAAFVSRVIDARPVHAAITQTAAGDGLKWWERGGAPNISDVHNAEEFLTALSNAGDKLVVVEFYATWCGSCRALYPKFCQIASDYSDATFLKVNFDENKSMCKSLMVKVLPFFHIYRGREGRLDAFSCSLSKIQKLKDAIAKHHDCVGEECATPEPLGDALGPIP